MIRPDPGRPSEQLSLLTEPGDEALAGHRFGRAPIAIPLWIWRLLWLPAGTGQWRSTCCGISPRSLPVAIAGCCPLRRLPRWVKVRVRSCILPSFLPGIGQSIPGSPRKNKHLKIWHGACLVQGRHRAIEQRTVMSNTDPVIAINQSKVANRPDSYETTTQAGPKVCSITTASHPDLPDGEQLASDPQRRRAASSRSRPLLYGVFAGDGAGPVVTASDQTVSGIFLLTARGQP
jgi:hypothetical protein